MHGIERMTRKVCQKMQNPDKYIEKANLNPEKLKGIISQKNSANIQRSLSMLENSMCAQGKASVAMQNAGKLLDSLK